MRQVDGADQIQQTESRDHERGGILARHHVIFLDADLRALFLSPSENQED